MDLSGWISCIWKYRERIPFVWQGNLGRPNLTFLAATIKDTPPNPHIHHHSYNYNYNLYKQCPLLLQVS